MRWSLLERYNPPASAPLHFIKGGRFEKLNVKVDVIGLSNTSDFFT